MTKSTGHNSIHEALLEAQSKFSKPAKNAENKHFGNKYADLESVLDAVLNALRHEGILLFQPIISSEFGHAAKTILHHVSSDTSIETEIPLLMQKQDMQGLKSASTYARRVGIENLTGLAPSDDDAEDNRKGTDFGAALKDSWQQSVLDSLPENATPRQKADAFADAICSEFAGKGEKALQNRWNKHQNLINSLEQRFPDLYGNVIDAYERAVMGNEGMAAE